MKTISEEYILQLAKLHDQKASFGDAKGLKQSEKYIKRYNPESVIDYGCGKGGVTLALQEAYPNMRVVGYDPGNSTYAAKPEGTFDMLISTDVLEHIEPVFLENVLRHMNGLFNKVAFFIIATSPAKKFLPDGRNAHLIVENPGWWKPLLEKYVGGKIVHHEFVEKTRTDKKGVIHPNNKYIVVMEK